jgi:hypothetical protein
MLLKSIGFTLYGQYVPPFEMQEGEIITINIVGYTNQGTTLEFALLDIFSGRQVHPSVTVHKPFTLIPYFRDNSWRRWFRKTKVSHVFKRYDVPIEVQHEICNLLYVKNDTPINHLAGSPRKQIMWYSGVTTNANIVIGLAGMDSKGVENAYQYTQKHLNPKGGAIIINIYGEEEGEGYSTQIIHCRLIPLGKEEMQELVRERLDKECITFYGDWAFSPIAYLECKQKYAILEVLKEFAQWIAEQAPEELKERVDFPFLISYMHSIADSPLSPEEAGKEMKQNSLLAKYFRTSEFLPIYHSNVIINVCVFCLQARIMPYRKLLRNIIRYFIYLPSFIGTEHPKKWTPRDYPECVKFLTLIEKHYFDTPY